MMYDICIIGAGMVGSAATRWTAQQKEMKVCLIGPQEPTDEEWKDSTRTIFGAHYDEGRIASEICGSRRNPTWQLLVQRSISRYRDLEKESGIQFFNEVGCVFKTTKSKTTHLHKMHSEKTTAQVLSADGLSQVFPYLRSDDYFNAIYEPKNSGYISPRKYVAANKKLAAKNGCDIIDEVVCEIIEKHRDNGEVYMEAVTLNGRSISAQRILLCTGAFTNFERLLPVGKEVDLTLRTQLAVVIEMYEEDVIRMSKMPCALVHLEDKNDPRNSYILPPIQYPDGKFYMKIGHYNDLSRNLKSYRDVTSWYRGKGKGQFNDMNSIYLRIHDTVTGFRPKSLHTKSCVTTATRTGQFYCDMVTPSLGVLTGGNDAGAMSADEVGRMGALMIVKGEWDHDLPAETFRLRYKEKKVESKSQL